MKIAPSQLNNRLNQLSLRAKLAFGFVLVLSSTVIVGTTSLFTEKRDGAAIERLLDTETRIADLSRNSDGAMSLTRQNEKDFLLQYRRIGFDEAKARYATLLKVEVAEIHQNMDAIRHLVADESVIRQTRAIDEAMDQFEKKFLVTTELIKQRGFFEVGVEGEFRKKIQEVETILTQQRAESLLVDMLTMRREEKNFLLGYREQDALALKEGAMQFQRRIADSNLQPDLKDTLLHMVSDYQALFEQYVRLDEQITTETETYRTVVHSVEPLLGELRTWALQRAAASRDQVLQSSKTNERIVLVTTAIAISLGSLLAFLLSRSIARGVNECMVFARRLAQGDLGARMKRPSGDEFGAIATALNSMAEQLQKNKTDLLAEITERKRVEVERQVISEIVRGVITTTNLDALLDLARRSVGKFLYAENCFVALHDTATDLVHFEFWVDKRDSVPPPQPVGKGHTRTSYVLRTGQPLLLTKELEAQLFDQGAIAKSGSASASWLGVPLRTPTRTIGVLAVQHYEKENAYNARDLQFLSSVADQIALAIERKQWEKALRDAEEKYRSIFEHSNDGIFQNTSEGRFLSANPALARMLGFDSPEELIRERGDIERQGYANPVMRNEFKRALEENGFVTNFEYEVFRKDGAKIWVAESARIVRDAEGRVLYYEGSVQEITERKRAEAELENIHKQLLEASRQGGMAEIATNVLHNVGNVLNSVNVSTGLMIESVKKSKASSLARVVVLLLEHADDLGEFITTDSRGKLVPAHLAQLSEHLMADQAAIVSELDSLRGNVEHIKEIVAMQQRYATFGGVKEMINVVNLVEDSMRMNEGALSRHRVEVIREFGNVPPMNVEKNKILQILVNLVRNAKYACDKSGRADKRLTVRVANGDGRVKILVMDNGVGISPENLTRIFSHGFTTWKNGHGFGLHSGALAAKEMGGSLTVQSDGAGQGAAFTLELPCENN